MQYVTRNVPSVNRVVSSHLIFFRAVRLCTEFIYAEDAGHERRKGTDVRVCTALCAVFYGFLRFCPVKVASFIRVQ